MKMKPLTLVAVVASFMFFGQAHAATQNVDGTPISNVDDCQMLTANVTVRLSAGVSGAYNCDDTANQMLYFGTCHEAGSRADREYKCKTADIAADSGHLCSGKAVDDVVTLTGRAAFLGNSNGGVISGLNLDADACTDTTIATRVTSYKSDIESGQ